LEGLKMQGFEILERAGEARAQLLTVERLPLTGLGEHAERRGASFLLVFDVGRVLVTSGGGALCARLVESAEDRPTGLVSSQEEEPWWRLLGGALSSVESDSEGGALQLVFETGGPVARVVTLSSEPDGVCCALVSAPG